MSTDVATIPQGAVQRQGFGSQEIEVRAETASVAVAAQAKAEIEAQYIVALRNPRDWEEVRVRLLKECRRTGFAQAARYSKPVGNTKIEGPSIRFAEAAIRCCRNLRPDTMVIYESDVQRMIRVALTDLEANITYGSCVVIDKTVERKSDKGREVLGERVNSYGDPVFIVKATEDELLNKQNALISKALRTHALRLLPGDILDECMAVVIGTLRERATKDPDAEKRAIIDAFAAIGVQPADLSAYLRHPIDRVQPAELVDLRAIYTSIRDGNQAWDDVMEAVNGGGSQEMVDDLKEKAKQKFDAMKAQEAAKNAPKQETPKAANPAPLTEAEMQAATAQADAPAEPPKPEKRYTFGGRK
jgi:hypothetical protein